MHAILLSVCHAEPSFGLMYQMNDIYIIYNSLVIHETLYSMKLRSNVHEVVEKSKLRHGVVIRPTCIYSRILVFLGRGRLY